MRYRTSVEEAEEWVPPLHLGTVNKLLITKKTTGAKHFVLWMGIMQPGAEATAHSHQVEQGFFILKGNVFIKIGKEEIQAGPNNAVFVPRETTHSLKVIGNEQVELLVWLCPPPRGGYP